MKKFNWKPIIPRNISQNSLWVKYQDDSWITEDIFPELFENFSLKPVAIELNNKSPTIDLKVLDRKAAQNILIFMRTTMKSLSREQILQSIFNCEIAIEIVDGLIECLPSPGLLKQLCELKCKDDRVLSEAEYFSFDVSKYPMEEFFSNIKYFKELMAKTYEEISNTCNAKYLSNKNANKLEATPFEESTHLANKKSVNDQFLCELTNSINARKMLKKGLCSSILLSSSLSFSNIFLFERFQK